MAVIGCFSESLGPGRRHQHRDDHLTRWMTNVDSMRTARSLSGRCTNKSTPTTKPFCSPLHQSVMFLDQLQTSITSSFLKLGHFSFEVHF